jgi:hypothetical protein
MSTAAPKCETHGIRQLNHESAVLGGRLGGPRGGLSVGPRVTLVTSRTIISATLQASSSWSCGRTSLRTTLLKRDSLLASGSGSKSASNRPNSSMRPNERPLLKHPTTNFRLTHFLLPQLLHYSTGDLYQLNSFFLQAIITLLV